MAGAAEPGRIKGIAFDEPEFAADHFVLGANVADNFNPLNEHPRAFVDFENNVDGLVFTVTVDSRAHVNKGDAQFTDLIGQVGNGFVDHFDVIPVAFFKFDGLGDVLNLQVAQTVVDFDYAETVSRPFIDGKSNEKVLAVRGQLGNGGNDAKISKAIG